MHLKTLQNLQYYRYDTKKNNELINYSRLFILLSKQPVKVAYLFQFAITGWFMDSENKRMGLNFSHLAVFGLIEAIISRKVQENLCTTSETEHQ